MLKIIFTKKVENDLKNISTFISDDNPINAIKTVKSIINTIDLISLYPYIGKEFDKNIREVIETTYKYKIVYEINKEYITVLSIYKYKNSWK